MHAMLVGEQSHDGARRREDEVCEQTQWLLGTLENSKVIDPQQKNQFPNNSQDTDVSLQV